MKDQYAGDINDYRKYGLLRGLVAETGLSLGVCWMLTPPDGRPDGAKTKYLLDRDKWRRYDPKLFDALHSVVHGVGPDGQPCERRVAAVEKAGILKDARFWSELVPSKSSSRAQYFAGVASWSAGCDLLFFDPDNGLEVKSRGDSAKYLFYQEVRDAYSRGQSILIYQHFPRKKRELFISEMAGRLREQTGSSTILAAVTSHVVFFLAARPEHSERCMNALREIGMRWDGQIQVCG